MKLQLIFFTIFSFLVFGTNAQCSGSIFYVSPSLSGEISKLNYLGNDNCTWVLDFSNYIGIVQFTFPLLDVESYYDYVRIYRGNYAPNTLLASFTGTVGSPLNFSVPNMFYLTFTSDSTYNGLGFTLNYTVLPIGYQDPYGCAQITYLTASSGTFGRTYGTSYEYCGWFIAPPLGYDYVTFTVSYFDISTVNIGGYDGVTSNSPYLGPFSPISTIHSTQASGIFIYYSAVGSTAGFTITYNAVVNPVVSTSSSSTGSSSCGGTFYSSSDSFYLSGYQSNSYCTWTIYPPYQSVDIYFSFFETESYYDVLTIYNSNGNIVGSYSGSQNPFIVTIADGLTVQLVFVSDSINNYGGFSATYYMSTSATTNADSIIVLDGDYYGGSSRVLLGPIVGGIVGVILLIAVVIIVVVVVVRMRRPQVQPVVMQMQQQPQPVVMQMQQQPQTMIIQNQPPAYEYAISQPQPVIVQNQALPPFAQPVQVVQ